VSGARLHPFNLSTPQWGCFDLTDRPTFDAKGIKWDYLKTGRVEKRVGVGGLPRLVG